MTRAITVRLDDADHAELTARAREIGVSPGILVHAGRSGNASASRSTEARDALERLVRRSRQRPPGDAVALVAEARAALDAER